MCGRAYSTYSEEELYLRYLNEQRKRKPLDLNPNYNLCPTQLHPVILIHEGAPAVAKMRWGLVPFWAESVAAASKYSLINCVGEEITEKRSFKQAFEKRRCIVPVSGFYEWMRPPSGKGAKRPFVIRPKEGKIMSLAGVWERWEDKESGEEVYSFAVITTRSNAVVGKIHNRMPVILCREDEARWLDPDFRDLEALKGFLKPCSARLLETYEVSTAVNSPKNNRPEILEPLSDSSRSQQ